MYRSIRILTSVITLTAVAGLCACGGGSSGGGLAATYSISSAVSGLGTGLTVILQDNGGDSLTVTANGTSPFTTAIAKGKTYAVTVMSQPANQTCTAAAPSGTVGTANVTVAINCVYNSSVASLDGPYVGMFYAIDEATIGNVPIGTTGTTNFDGNGNFAEPTSTINANGTVVSNAAVNVTGTYAVAANGTTGLNSVIDGGIIGQDGNASILGDLVSGDMPYMAINVKSGSGLSTASIAGNFTFVTLSYGATSATQYLATATYDSTGNATGTYSENESGVITTGTANIDPVTVAANGAMTDTAGDIGGLSADTNLFVLGDFLSGDDPKIIVGVRTGSAMTTTAVSGQYTGVDYNGEVAGGFANTSLTVLNAIFDGNGNFSGTFTNNTAGVITTGSGSGTYTVQANGSVTLQGANGGGSYQGAVSVDGNSIVLANMTNANAPEIIVLFRQ